MKMTDFYIFYLPVAQAHVKSEVLLKGEDTGRGEKGCLMSTEKKAAEDADRRPPHTLLMVDINQEMQLLTLMALVPVL